jgi:hypothetical protein
MLIFLNFGGGFGGGRWYIGPLITLLPLLLTSGLPILQAVSSLLVSWLRPSAVGAVHQARPFIPTLLLLLL